MDVQSFVIGLLGLVLQVFAGILIYIRLGCCGNTKVKLPRAAGDDEAIVLNRILWDTLYYRRPGHAAEFTTVWSFFPIKIRRE